MGSLPVRARHGIVSGALMMSLSCGDGGSPSGPVDPVDPVASVEVSPPQSNLVVADTVRLVAVARTSSGKPVADRRFAWLSDRRDVAVVDSLGLVTAMGSGQATISVTTSGRTARAVIRVSEPPEPAPTLTGLEPASIQAGWGTFTMKVRGTGFTSASRVRWDDLILETVFLADTVLDARVDSARVRSPDTVQVRVDQGGDGSSRSAPLPFVVHPRPVHAIDLRLPGNTVFLGGWTLRSAVARDQFGRELPDAVITWSVTDSSVVGFEGEHMIGRQVGAVSLTARSGNASASMTYHVMVAPASGLVFESPVGPVSELFTRPLGSGSISRLQPQGAWGAQPAVQPGGERVAFVGRTDGNQDIWVVGLDGTGLRRLTDDPAVDDQPAWSPDGRTIAFRSTRSGKSDIWVVPAGGGTARNLTGAGVGLPEEVNDRPDWAPSGDRIVFSRGVGLGQSLYTVRPDGSDLRELATRPGHDLLEPAYSPDGRLIAVRVRERASGGQDRVELLSVEDGSFQFLIVPLAAGSRTPTWIGTGWLVMSSRGLAGTAGETVVMVHLGTGRTSAPLAFERSITLEPAAVLSGEG